MTNKESYLQLCESPQGESIPLFLQHWWMDAVCQKDEWDVALARDAGGRIVAALPYHLRRKWGMKFILQPQLTQFNGPHYFYPDGFSPRRKFDFEKQAVGQLVDHLSSLNLAYYEQCFSPEVRNWLPFYWHGFRQTTRYTYQLPDITQLDEVFSHFDKTKERQRRIRQIADKYVVDVDISPDRFARFHADYWASRGQHDLLSHDFIERVIRSASDRGQGLTMGLRDADGRLVVAWFVVYDACCAHALLSAMAVGERDNGVTALLIWRLIERLSTRTRAFDFEGSMNETTEYFYRSFGAEQVPYFRVWKSRNEVVELIMRIKTR